MDDLLITRLDQLQRHVGAEQVEVELVDSIRNEGATCLHFNPAIQARRRAMTGPPYDPAKILYRRTANIKQSVSTLHFHSHRSPSRRKFCSQTPKPSVLSPLTRHCPSRLSLGKASGLEDRRSIWVQHPSGLHTMDQARPAKISQDSESKASESVICLPSVPTFGCKG